LPRTNRHQRFAPGDTPPAGRLLSETTDETSDEDIYKLDQAQPDKQTVQVESSGTIYNARGIRLLAGSNVTLTENWDSAYERLDVTVASTGGGGGDTATYQTLPTDAVTNSTTTFATVMTTSGLLAGTYIFRYYLRYQSGATATGVKFTVNYTGTTSAFMFTRMYQTTGGAAATGVDDQTTVGTTAQMIEGRSARAKGVDPGSTSGVDTANADLFSYIEGLMIATGTGNLELRHASEVAAASTVKAGTSLILHKVA
jgi:hypothetical protein